MTGQYNSASIIYPITQVSTGTKRASDNDNSDVSTRATKVAKNSRAPLSSKARKGAKKTAKVRYLFWSFIGLTYLLVPFVRWHFQTAIPAATFMADSAPLHVNLTHTPPSIEDDPISSATADPGFIGNLTLVPSNFSTGSYGWKGSKRITVVLQNTDKEAEKVQVMLT